jgi:hypothetical protein
LAHRQLARQLFFVEQANLPYLEGVHGSTGGRLHFASDEDGHAVKTSIAVRARIDAHEMRRATNDGSSLFEQLPSKRRAESLPPLERAARQRPGSRVGAPDEEPSSVLSACSGYDADHRMAQDVARRFAKYRPGRTG